MAALRKEEKLRSAKDEIRDVKRLRTSGKGDDAVDKELEKVLEKNKVYKRGEGDRSRAVKSAKRKGYVSINNNACPHLIDMLQCKYIQDRKYGHGGKNARKSKLNDAKYVLIVMQFDVSNTLYSPIINLCTRSLNDLSDFNPRGGALNRRDKGGKHSSNSVHAGRRGGAKNMSSKRPGKAARATARKSRSS